MNLVWISHDQQIHELAFKCSFEDTRTIGVFKQLNMKDMEKIYIDGTIKEHFRKQILRQELHLRVPAFLCDKHFSVKCLLLISKDKLPYHKYLLLLPLRELQHKYQCSLFLIAPPQSSAT